MPVELPVELEGRCGSCARFVRVKETIDQNGEVRREGQCLLGVWPSPLYETNTCSQYRKRGTVGLIPLRAPRERRHSPRPTAPHAAARPRPSLEIPEELLDMDADEFREVLREVLRDELGTSPIELGGRW